MTDVACVGVVVRDLIFTVPALPSGPGKTHASSRREVGGGLAANAAAAVATLGGKARFIGAVGDDHLGSELMAELSETGVDVSRVRVIPGHVSPLSAVTVDGSGERAIVNHTDPALFEVASPITGADLERTRTVLVDTRWPEAARSALVWAVEQGIPGVVDYDVGAGSTEGLLEPASHVVFSAGALRRLADTEDLGQGLRRVAGQTDAWLAVTDGGNGTFWLEDGEVKHRASFEVEVVDTTGAGDVYHGAFALALAEGATEQDAVRMATASAALSCTRIGGRAGIPSRDEVETLLQEPS